MTDLATCPVGPLPGDLTLDERPPLQWLVTPNGEGAWVVSDYWLGRKVLADRRFSRAASVTPNAPKLSVLNPSQVSIISTDGTEHARLRRSIAGYVTERRIAGLRPVIDGLSHKLLDRMAMLGPPADFVSAYTAHLPLNALCHVLGVPVEDQQAFRTLVPVLFELVNDAADARKRGYRLAEYMTKLIARKREEPGADLLSTLIRAADGNDRLTGRELVTIGLSLLMAGFDSTSDQITLCFLSLLHGSSERLAALRADRDKVPAVVEEILRFNPSPPVSFSRVAVEDVELGDVTIRKGQPVVVFTMGANLDTGAGNTTRAEPRHLTFGHGPHRCVGASLARLQLNVAVSSVLARFPNLRLAEDATSLRWKTGSATRGLTGMRVTW